MITAVTAACLAVLAVVGLVVVLSRRGREEQPVRPPVTPWHSLSQVGSPQPITAAGRVRLAIRDGRGYAAWNEGAGRLVLGAVDLKTGAMAWTTELPNAANQVLTVTVLRQVVVVAAVLGNGSSLGVVDADKGTPLWQSSLDEAKSADDPLGQELLF